MTYDDKLRSRYRWVVLGVAFFSLFLASGARTSFGVFFTPMLADFQTGRASLSLAISVGMLLGALSQPFLGRLADSLGSKVVLSSGALLMGLGCLALAFTQNLLQLYVLFGLVMGLGFSAAGLIPATAMVTRWFVERKGFALSIAVSGFALGQTVLVPINAQLILTLGWRMAYAAMGLLFLLILLPVILWLARSDPRPVPAAGGVRSPFLAKDDAGTSLAQGPAPVAQVLASRPFWLLVASFSVCGFTVGLIYTHLVPYALDSGLPPLVAANMIALMGLVGIVGSVGISSLSDRVGRKNPMGVLYFARALSLFVLALVVTPATFPLIALTMGFSRGTGPLTSALAGDLYGRLSMGTTFGLIFLFHEVASSLGSYAGGLAFDVTGSYQPAFLAAAFMGLAASAAAFSIREKPGLSERQSAKGPEIARP